MAVYIESFDSEPRVIARTTVPHDRRGEIVYEVLVDHAVVWSQHAPPGLRLTHRSLIAREQEAVARRQIDRLAVDRG